ncbi:MAG: beta-lactamase family protein, partial [bacterium]|nr:beta-lactamase family protein [bacterium]
EAVNKKLKSWQIPGNSHTREHQVTLRHLLTHQSGLNRPPGGFGYEDGRIPSLIQVLKGEAPATNKAVVIEFVPGTQSGYSNFGYLVLQLLLEDVTGKPFAQIAQETVFAPLGMKSATLTHPMPAALKTRVALPHDKEGKAHQRSLHPTALGQGGLSVTPSDLALFTVELMRA